MTIIKKETTEEGETIPFQQSGTEMPLNFLPSLTTYLQRVFDSPEKIKLALNLKGAPWLSLTE